MPALGEGGADGAAETRRAAYLGIHGGAYSERWLKARGLLHEPPRGWVTVRKRRGRRLNARRKPRECVVRKAGDLVQVDTMDVRPLPGVVFKHLTARDMVSRWDVVEAHPRATAKAATQSVDSVLARMPIKVRAIQVDGGSEFQG